MDILYLSHCTPNPPDKGEKIRAHQEVLRLARAHRVHLVCFARNAADLEAAKALETVCASAHAELLSFPAALARGLTRFAAGGCLTEAFYGSEGLRRRVAELTASNCIAATLAYSSAMAPYAPAGIPLVLDMVDVDSEKWFQYAAERFPGFLYRAEGVRLRRLETEYAAAASLSILATAREESLLRGFAPGAATAAIENGVDLDYFDPAAAPPLPELEGKRLLAFVGAMDYYPNATAAVRFAERVFPQLRAADPALEFWIVGRNPGKSVSRLAAAAGVSVTGSVPDVRPYLNAATAVAAPLEIARGIQNKVLEALAMGKPVLASTAVCRTFGELPAGVVRCDAAGEYLAAWRARAPRGATPELSIREAARGRFSWDSNLARLEAALVAAAGEAARPNGAR